MHLPDRSLPVNNVGYYSGVAYAGAQAAIEVPYIIIQSILFSLLVRHALPVHYPSSHFVQVCIQEAL